VLSVKNREIFNFDTLKEQILHKAYGGDFTMEEDEEDERDELPITIDFQPRKKQKLVMHKNETIMVRDKFQLKVQENAGKVLNMGYDKRCIVVPNVPIEQVKEVKTLPYGHVDTYKLHLAKTFKSMDIAERICSFL
jgi:hypothetical protein